ncbi:hypothetical protein DOTSEDRAFT_49044 [Lecanosticta acicola]|uniref:RRM domain-containing protein n=1 Tax=Lecanosticta acicola TaxID=111012 RepID=A0AAI8YUR0_9PEZI|nr:hypothetical protein DOTSEDRAFT_49044 [Lecanosticta acicola]
MSGYNSNGGWAFQGQDDKDRNLQPRTAAYDFIPNNSYYSGPAAPLDGNSRLNPNPGPYIPPQRRQQMDPIVRPESSISNISFATQLPNAPFTPFQQSLRTATGAGPGYGQNWSYNGSYNGGSTIPSLGAGLSNVRMSGGDIGGYRSLPSVNEGSERGSRSGTEKGEQPARNDSFALAVNANIEPRRLVNLIMSGATEDPYDRTLNRYDHSDRMPAPSLGPARFQDTKMFSTADTSSPDTSLAHSTQPQTSWLLTPKPVPDWLDLAIRGECKPNLDEAYEALPLLELGRQIAPSKAGVIRIKDIPYATTRQEMTAFVGRNAQILRQPQGSPYHAVHIMMERETGKTMDCFIEFASPNEAAYVARQFARRVEAGRPPKVGDREVEVVYSSQDELLSELFPRAKHTRFSGGQPVIDKAPRKYYADVDADGFKCFVHPEECIMLIKFANMSDRAPFASKSPCRVYEHWITTLVKFPWYALDYITIKERRRMFDCTVELLRILVEHLRRSNGRYSPLEPTPAILQELVVAALTCPGFSEKQKHSIVFQMSQHGYKSMADGHSVNVRLGGHHELCSTWPFASLGVIPGTDRNLLLFFAGLFRKATATSPEKSGSLASRMTSQNAGIDKPMGNLKIKYPGNSDEMSLSDVAKLEYGYVENMLKAVLPLPPAPTGSGSGSGSGSGGHGSSFDFGGAGGYGSGPGSNASTARSARSGRTLN